MVHRRCPVYVLLRQSMCYEKIKLLATNSNYINRIKINIFSFKIPLSPKCSNVDICDKFVHNNYNKV